MGRMKSLGYAYAEHLGDGVDVDWYFESIVNGEIEIPKWFVEEWLEANPIFASEYNEETFEAQIGYDGARGFLSTMKEGLRVQMKKVISLLMKRTFKNSFWTP